MSTLIEHFAVEFRRYRDLADKAMAQVPDDALNRVPGPDANSIAMIVRHISGNLRSRFTDFLTTDGEKPWRDRDSEFVERPYTRDELRDELVPINRKYPIAELMDACRSYPGLSNAKRITFEYVMLKGVNDSLADAKALVRLLQGIPAKINLIPFNPWPGTKYECSDWEQIEKFSEVVFNAGYASPVRTPRGRDILAACGQLKSATEKLSARERMALRAMAMTD